MQGDSSASVRWHWGLDVTEKGDGRAKRCRGIPRHPGSKRAPTQLIRKRGTAEERSDDAGGFRAKTHGLVGSHSRARRLADPPGSLRSPVPPEGRTNRVSSPSSPFQGVVARLCDAGQRCTLVVGVLAITKGAPLMSVHDRAVEYRRRLVAVIEASPNRRRRVGRPGFITRRSIGGVPRQPVTHPTSGWGGLRCCWVAGLWGQRWRIRLRVLAGSLTACGMPVWWCQRRRCGGCWSSIGSTPASCGTSCWNNMLGVRCHPLWWHRHRPVGLGGSMLRYPGTWSRWTVSISGRSKRPNWDVGSIPRDRSGSTPRSMWHRRTRG
jgi:hypothetical protein